MYDLDESQKRALVAAALDLRVPPNWLYDLIRFETAGTFSPTIKNPGSSARGLIQFTDATARAMGFSSSSDLVSRFPDFESQLLGPVVRYLGRYKPFENRQGLYMAVFYPAARAWPLHRRFPDYVREANPGIDTVGDYMAKVDGHGDGQGGLLAAAFWVTAITILAKLWREKQKGR